MNIFELVQVHEMGNYAEIVIRNKDDSIVYAGNLKAVPNPQDYTPSRRNVMSKEYDLMTAFDKKLKELHNLYREIVTTPQASLAETLRLKCELAHCKIVIKSQNRVLENQDEEVIKLQRVEELYTTWEKEQNSWDPDGIVVWRSTIKRRMTQLRNVLNL